MVVLPLGLAHHKHKEGSDQYHWHNNQREVPKRSTGFRRRAIRNGRFGFAREHIIFKKRAYTTLNIRLLSRLVLAFWGNLDIVTLTLNFANFAFVGTRNNLRNRYFFIQIDAEIAAELLRFIILCHSGATPTRPQAERAVLAVKTSKPGARFQLGGGVTLLFKERTFIVQTP